MQAPPEGGGKSDASASLRALARLRRAHVASAETSLLDFWFSQPMPWQEFLLALAFGLFPIFLAWLSFASPLRTFLQSCAGVSPPFVSVVATLFALMVTFLAQDIWDSNRAARRAINQEREQLLALDALSKTNGVLDKELRDAIRDYVEAVVGLEWRTMENGESASEAEGALNTLTRLAAKTSVDPRYESAVSNTVMRLRSARETRLSIANAFPDDQKWAAVFLLAFLTQIGIAATNLERARPQLLAQLIFAAAAVVSISLIASVERPFAPPTAASALPLAEVLALNQAK